GPVMSAVNAALGMAGAALPVLAALVVGLTAGRFPVRRFAPALTCLLLMQLVLQPMLGFLLVPLFPLSPVERSVTALYAALPVTGREAEVAEGADGGATAAGPSAIHHPTSSQYPVLCHAGGRVRQSTGFIRRFDWLSIISAMRVQC
ncbi:MAG: hypothetical protein INR62_06755, partial [Rhodospirillales bacterium]|nr:hypothetical protein [Acetobacter sp.]